MEHESQFLHCPRCRRSIRLDEITDGFGVGRCGCGEIPVAEGVIVVDRGELQAALIGAVRAGARGRARKLIRGSHDRTARLIELLGMRPTFERFVRHRILAEIVNTLHLGPLLERLPPKRATQTLLAAAQWNDYARHRFSSPALLATTALLGLLRGREGYILDAPCGMGHLSFLLSKLAPPEQIVAMDLSPAFVYSARRFFVPHLAAAIVHDMNHPLPLRDSTFGAIFCSDAFHYVENRAGLSREFMRILRDDGVCVLAHVHNRLHETSYAGAPLSPAEYAQLFAHSHVRIVPETHLLNAFLDNRAIDLSRPLPEEELNVHRVLYVVAAKSPDVFGPIPPSRDVLIESPHNPRPNGLYRMRHQGNEIVFTLRIPPSLRSEYANIRQILLPQVTVPARRCTNRNGRLHFENERELLEKHVLVDVPAYE